MQYAFIRIMVDVRIRRYTTQIWPNQLTPPVCVLDYWSLPVRDLMHPLPANPTCLCAGLLEPACERSDAPLSQVT